ncbi:hypothetical protein BSPWISOXPB_3913 [uncultured Gammaproteobacteria bacterium]|nr:hypothetical protein BSPWISOXPB_3913 [uncultured Gammaproteobacteria bacterium]
MRGYVVDVYFCVFDVSVEEFGVDLDLDLGFRIGIGIGFKIGFDELDLELFWSMSAIWILPLPRVARTFGFRIVFVVGVIKADTVEFG